MWRKAHWWHLHSDQNKKYSNKWTLKEQYLMIFLENKMLCNKKKIISNILLLCLTISLFDTAWVCDNKSCSMQYIPLHVFFLSIFLWLKTQCCKTGSEKLYSGKQRCSIMQRIPLLVVHRRIFSALAMTGLCFAYIHAPGEGWSSVPCPSSSNVTP